MSVTKDLIEQERQAVKAGRLSDIHLHQEGSFLRAYDWSAWLCCRYLHDFKVNKRAFKGIDEPVAYIGFPETSLQKWIPEGAEQRSESEKHLVLSQVYEEICAAGGRTYHRRLRIVLGIADS